jgi:hypothetical protein
VSRHSEATIQYHRRFSSPTDRNHRERPSEHMCCQACGLSSSARLWPRKCPALVFITICCGCRQPSLTVSNEVGVAKTRVSDERLVMTYASTWHRSASATSTLDYYTSWYHLRRMPSKLSKLYPLIRSFFPDTFRLWQRLYHR